MKTRRLRNQLLLGAAAIGGAMALAFMATVSWVISEQYQEQSSTVLTKASNIINHTLSERKSGLLSVTRQLASQKNLGSTLWYLSQYSTSGLNNDILFNTYQQLIKDAYKIRRVAQLTRISIYDQTGKLIVFSSYDNNIERVGFIEHASAPLFLVSKLKSGEELNRDNLRMVTSVANINSQFGRPLPIQESVHYVVIDGLVAIESYVPIMDEVFDAITGKQQIKQMGLVNTIQILDHDFTTHLAQLTDIKLNLFTSQGLSSGDIPAYQHPDLSGAKGISSMPVLNEINIRGEGYYQSLIALYNGDERIGTIAALYSKSISWKNTQEMIGILALIAVVTLLLIAPVVWYLANSIASPIAALGRIFKDVASGRQSVVQSGKLNELEVSKTDEISDLTSSFVAMNNAISQHIQHIHELNTSLEEKVAHRTHELSLANQELTKLATQDALTGLPNRNLVMDRLKRALIAAKREHRHVALMFIDLDEFKPVNDTHGHDAGDQLLQQVAQRIQCCLRESDTVSRIGGDEFVVLLPVIETIRDAEDLARKICVETSQPFDYKGYILNISSSIGIAIYPEHGRDDTELLTNADAAMYLAKTSGRNAVRMYQPA
ncbi:MAG: diguanylate cyclase [Gallionella sp.]|nr:diguanylate cyclase [Gallionella sp.]